MRIYSLKKLFSAPEVTLIPFSLARSLQLPVASAKLLAWTLSSGESDRLRRLRPLEAGVAKLDAFEEE